MWERVAFMMIYEVDWGVFCPPPPLMAGSHGVRVCFAKLVLSDDEEERERERRERGALQF